MRTPGELHNTHEVVYKNLSNGASTMFAVAQIHPLITREEAIANAEFICKAVNSHDLLVEALEKAKEQLWHPAASNYGEDRYRCQPSVCPACIVEAALEKAKGEKEHC